MNRTMLDHHNLHFLSLFKKLRNSFMFFLPRLGHNDSYYWSHIVVIRPCTCYIF
uniref:Uncharacterized protein n=1 Tax=Solanum lycopersicum TaxID=4081 RepID=A0A494GA94_SOLLC